MGINGDIQHKLMSLHVSSIETLNKPAHIFVYFFLFVDWLVWEKKKEMQKELRIMPREDKPNVHLVFGDHRFHMFTDDVRSGERRQKLQGAARSS